jgi:hypothetical protein
VKWLLISICIVCYWFHAIVYSVEQVAINTFAPKTAIGVNLAKELDALILLRYPTDFLELAAKEP